MWTQAIIVLFVSLLVTILATPLAKKIASSLDAIDYPDQRRVNKIPVPRMGGIAIFCGCFATIFTTWLLITQFHFPDIFKYAPGSPINYVYIAIGSTFMFLVGVIDDAINMKATHKLIGQIIASCIVASSGLTISFIQNPLSPGSIIQFGAFSYPLTVFYLVAFANIINLIDGLDGLAAGISAISAATITIYAVIIGKWDAAIIGFMIVGACIGFLKSNFHPASIFMGDSGSLLLGLSLGILSLLAIARTAFVFSLLVPILAAGVPITDTAVAIIRRKKNHHPINTPDRGHIHHRLLDAGLSQRNAVLVMWGWTLVLSICGLVFAELDGIAKPISLIIAAGITFFAIIKLHLLSDALTHYYSPRKRRKKINK